MKFRLESLPTTVLSEAFAYVDSGPLLDLRFLNKNLFNIIGNVIYKHLQYSTYYNPFSNKNIQDIFNENNNLDIIHLRINSLSSLKKLIANNIATTIKNNKFINLRSLHISICTSDIFYPNSEASGEIEKLFFQMEKVTLNLNRYDKFDRLLSLFDIKKLKSLSVFNKWGALIINNILKFKEFVRLEELKLCAEMLEIKSEHLIDSNTNIFPSLNNLEIEVYYKVDMNINILKNADQLRILTLELPEYNVDVMNFIKNSKSLTKIYLKFVEVRSNVNLATFLNQLNSLLILNKDIVLLFSKMSHRGWEDTNVDMPTLFYINEIEFDLISVEINYLSNMLKYFPNINKIRIKNSYISEETNETLVLPNNSNSSLLYIDRNTLESLKDIAQLNSINIYIY